MSETLEPIVVKKIELRQTRAALYQLIVRTNDRDESYVGSTAGRREADGRLKRIDLMDSMNAMSVITERLNAVEIVEAARDIKEYFDDMNREIDKINTIAGNEKQMVKTVIGAMFGNEVVIMS